MEFRPRGDIPRPDQANNIVFINMLQNVCINLENLCTWLDDSKFVFWGQWNSSSIADRPLGEPRSVSVPHFDVNNFFLAHKTE